MRKGLAWGGEAENLLTRVVEFPILKIYWNVRDATKRQPAVEAFKLDSTILRLIPAIEDVTFVAPSKPKTRR
jgi:hypothetical protein